MAARLGLPSCVKRWQAAQQSVPAAWDSLSHCRGCPIGAVRAGSTVAVANAAAAADAIRAVCPRCERPSPRQINSRWCTSCYNRTREASIGKNAKGGRPLICDVIHPERIAAAAGAAAARVELVERVVTRTEAVAVLMRRGMGVFGIPPLPRPVGWQMELAL